jgi:hypothetical protein
MRRESRSRTDDLPWSCISLSMKLRKNVTVAGPSAWQRILPMKECNVLIARVPSAARLLQHVEPKHEHAAGSPGAAGRYCAPGRVASEAHGCETQHVAHVMICIHNCSRVETKLGSGVAPNAIGCVGAATASEVESAERESAVMHVQHDHSLRKKHGR